MSVVLLRDLFTFVTVASLIFIGAIITLRAGRAPVETADRSDLFFNAFRLIFGLATSMAFLLMVQGWIGIRFGYLF